MSALTDFLCTAVEEEKQLAWLLTTGNVSERTEAADALARMQCVDAAWLVAEQIPDFFPDVTQELLRALWQLDPHEAVKRAQRVVADVDVLQCNVAQKFLIETLGYDGRFDAEGIQLIIEKLISPVEAERRQAREELLTMPSASTVVAMEQCAVTHESPDLVAEVLGLMHEIIPAKAMKTAELVMKRKGPTWASVAARAMVRSDDIELGLTPLLMKLSGVMPHQIARRPELREIAVPIVKHRYREAMDVLRSWLGHSSTLRRRHGLQALAVLCQRGMTEKELASHATSIINDALPHLRSSTTSLAVGAAAVLCSAPWDATTQLPETMLAHNEPDVRAMVIEAIVARGGGLQEQVERMIGDSSPQVQVAVKRAFQAWGITVARIAEIIEELVKSTRAESKVAGLIAITSHRVSVSPAKLRSLASHRAESVRAAALKAIEAVQPTLMRSVLLDRLRDRAADPRKLAVEKLADWGEVCDIEAISELLRDDYPTVRQATLNTLCKLAPERAGEFAELLLDDYDDDIVRAALGKLDPADMVQKCLTKLRSPRTHNPRILLDEVQKRAPELLSSAVLNASSSGALEARTLAAQRALSALPELAAVELLRRLGKDGHAQVRHAALKQLLTTKPADQREIISHMVVDRDARVRLEGVQALEGLKDSETADDLLRAVRDEDSYVRLAALRGLAAHDDPRVLPELISSLNDVDEEVREVAEELVDGSCKVLEGIPNARQFVRAVQAQVELINRWASRIGYELLGKSVAVLNYRQGLGRTRAERKPGLVEIEVSDAPVVSGHPHGEQIMKALALHEIGHHLYDIGIRGDKALRGVARSEKIYDIYHLLSDERLERALRSRRPYWAIYFDRLASYAFAQNSHSIPIDELAKVLKKTSSEVALEISQGALPGKIVDRGGATWVVMTDADTLKLPDLMPVHVGFLACLRCGFDPRMCPDPRVGQAIAEVPHNLRNLSNKQLLQLARRIAEILGASDQAQSDMNNMNRNLRSSRRMQRMMDRIMDRLNQGKRLPDWMRKEVKGIRRNSTSVYEPNTPRSKGTGGQGLNLGPELSFNPLAKEQKIAANQGSHAELVGSISKHVRRLRAFLERLGKREIDEYAMRRGRRLDLGVIPRALVTRSPNLLVHSHEETWPDAYIGVLIDRSGSMEGNKLELAKRFGALVAEAARGLRGLAGHVNAFDDDTFFRLGDFQRHSTSELESGGGNNDAGGLQGAADLAQKSRKRNKMLIMISDGSPTDCTVAALRNLVERLTRDYGMICAQVAVDSLEEQCFQHFVDLTNIPMDEAVARFGRMLIDLTRHWR